jgi:uncharacterized protein (TIGR02996 family)
MPRNPELEAAVASNPDDDQAYLVYADWLQQQGDPRGELIVKHARAADPDAFVAEHETDLLGALADYKDMLEPRAWRCGYLHKVKVANTFDRSPMHDGKEPAFPVDELLALLLDEDAGRFVQDLTLGIVDYESNEYTTCLAALATRRVPSLRALYVGDFHSEETELNWSHIGEALTFYPAVPNLQQLTLRSGGMALGQIDLPELRTFATLTGGLKKDAIASITTAHWPKLERLELQIGSRRYSSDIGAEDLQPLLDGESLPPTLYHLALANFDHTNDLVPMLAASKILPRLRNLDLSQGTFNAEGAEALIAARSAFAHLTMIDLGESWLDPEWTARIREVFPNAVVEGQRFNPRYPDDFYIAAGE